ncbi:hypothetical protein J4221_01310 [Candidatus Pacearchaeota archaeon]|nr:hypothetical protein [Candidatus Pacearchaeota archaeon]
MEVLEEEIRRVNRSYIPLRKSHEEVRRELEKEGFIYESRNVENVGRISSNDIYPVAWLIGDNLFLVNEDLYKEYHETIKKIAGY